MKAIKFGLACLFSLALFVSCLDGGDNFNSAEQFTKDLQAIDNYLATNGISAYEDPSGVRFTISSIGTAGLPPKRNHEVKVAYTGRLFSDGTVFDDGTIEGALNGFIDGWIEGLEVFPEGTVGTLYIPSGRAYGNRSQGSIPANSILVFDVELLEVSRSTAEQQKLEDDIATIDTYLADNEIEAEIDPSGIRYVLHEGTPEILPTWYDQVRVNYSARLLDATTDFYTGTSEPDNGVGSRVVDYILGMQAGMLRTPTGGEATMYIPSPLALGSQSTTDVPANSILVIRINSLEIVE